MTIARRVLVPILVGFFLLFVGVWGFWLLTTRNTNLAQEEANIRRLEQIFQDRISSLRDFSLALAMEAASQPAIQKAFAEQDRQALIDLTLPGYLLLDEQFDVPQYQFHLPPAVSFLRLHQINQFGDDLSSFRFTVLAANAEKKPVAGVEIGRGGLGMRGVAPVSYEGEHIGTVEFGLNIDQTLLNDIQEQFGGDWQLMIRRGPAETATFAGAIENVEIPTTELLLQASTLDQPFFATASLYENSLAGETNVTFSSFDGREYVTLRAPLKDFSGNIIGLIEVISDRTIVVQSQNTRLILGILTGLAVLGIGSTVLAWQINRLLRPIRTITQAATAITTGGLNQSVTVSSKDDLGALAKAFNEMTSRLRNSVENLEQQVTQRTLDLELRSAYLRASAEVSRAIATILDPDALRQSVVSLVRERFSLYYVGLFELDESGEWAYLRAGTGEAGKAMLARKHRIQFGAGMVGWCIANATPRIALEAEQDAVRLANPDLPDTRSEAALPLRSRDRVFGALTIQSAFPDAFTPDNITTFQILADQVAVALDNARLFSDNQEALTTLQRVYGDLSENAWRELILGRSQLAYRSDEHGIHPAGDVSYPEMETALRKGELTVIDDPAPNAQTPLAVPIKVRGSVIGVLDTRKSQPGESWTHDEVTLLEEVATQLGAALESARLYSDTQRSAARERLTGVITSRMRESLDIEQVLQTAAREMRNILNLAEAEVRLKAPEREPGLPDAARPQESLE